MQDFKELEEYLYNRVKPVIMNWREQDISDAYAVSFFVYSNECFIYRGISNVTEFSVGYVTERDCGNAPELSEDRWNFPPLIDNTRILQPGNVGSDSSNGHWMASVTHRMQEEGVIRRDFDASLLTVDDVQSVVDWFMRNSGIADSIPVMQPIKATKEIPEYQDDCMDFIFDWYARNGVDNVGFEDSKWDVNYDSEGRYIGKGPNGFWEIWVAAGNVARRLQEEGVIRQVFGAPLPIIVHQMGLHDEIMHRTIYANPNGEADSFAKYYENILRECRRK